MQRNGKKERAVIEVLLQIPEQRIAWRSIADDLGVGVVSFEPRSTGTTEFRLKLRSLFDPATSTQRATEYLGNFKRVAGNSN